DAGVRARLAPFVAALPGTTPINVNTASPEVLATVVEGLELDSARLIVARRNVSYYRSNADFFAQLPKSAIAPEQDIRVGSDYFLAMLSVTSGGAQVQGKALLARLEPARWPT